MVGWNFLGVTPALEHFFGTFSHSYDFRRDELERGVTQPIEFVDFEMVCGQAYLGMTINAGVGLGYNLESGKQKCTGIKVMRCTNQLFGPFGREDIPQQLYP